jgi:hypothetical protein
VRVFEGLTFTGVRHDGEPPVVEALEFRSCGFVDCHVGHVSLTGGRTTFRAIAMVGCTVERCSLGPVILEDCRFERLQLHPGHRMLATLRGVAFVRTTIAGPVRGRLKVEPEPHHGSPSRRAIEAENTSLYETLDWALDISRAEFTGAELNGVPAHLVRRDAESQAVVRAERARGADLDRLEVGPFAVSIRRMLDEGWRDVVLIAARRGKRFDDEIQDIRRLREAGIAELG